MKDEVVVIALTILALLCGFAAGVGVSSNSLKEEAIERGFAQYCPTTGDWGWKGEKDD